MGRKYNIISLNDIMEKIRKSEINKILYGTYLVLPATDIKIDNVIRSEKIKIGECYIKNIGNYSVIKPSGPVYVNICDFRNHSDIEQHFNSSSTAITYSHSKTTQLSAGLDLGEKFSLDTKIRFGELAEETSLTFHVDTSTSYTETQSITQKIEPQSIRVPPQSCAHVKAVMMNMKITGEVMVCIGLSRYEKGNAYITRPQKKHVEYEIDMLSHVAPSAMPPFPYDTIPKPITFKELRRGHTDPVELWTTGTYNFDSATISTISVDITPIDSDEIVSSYSIEL